MKHISIILPYDAIIASIVDPRTMFTGSNDFMQLLGREPIFNVEFVGLEKEVRLANGQFSVYASKLINEVKKTDLIIIPALGGNMAESLKKNAGYIPWIIERHKEGAEVASLCVGSFLLASTGLLDGKECSSHWLTANVFRDLFPKVTLVDGRIITEQNGLYSSGGATSYWNLLLHLVEKYAGREIAILAAKIYALEIDRESQTPFTMFQGQKNHTDTPIKEAQEFIEKNITEKITVEDLAVMFAIGKRHFERRFKKATNNTPGEYIQRVKIEAAKKELERSSKNVSEVMYEIGYNDLKTFRVAFKKFTGLSPVDYKKRYNKEGAIA